MGSSKRKNWKWGYLFASVLVCAAVVALGVYEYLHRQTPSNPLVPQPIQWVSVEEASKDNDPHTDDYIFFEQAGKEYVAFYDDPATRAAFVGADPASFLIGISGSVTVGYVKDKTHVWYFDTVTSDDGQDEFLVQQVTGADPASFEILFLKSSEVKLVPDAASGTLTAENTDVYYEEGAQDKNHTYNGAQVVQ